MKANAKSVDGFRKSGAYLPQMLRDFHDQKDLFKLIHRVTNVEENEYCKEVTWVAGQCYVIDVFLWTMAKFGFTLQRSRANVEFISLHDAIKAHKAEQTELFKQLLAQDAP